MLINKKKATAYLRSPFCTNDLEIIRLPNPTKLA